MKTILKQISEKSLQKERAERIAINAEIGNPSTPNDRRNFLKKAALGGIALGGLMHLSIEDTIAQTTQNVSRSSSPSDLKITDLRFAEKGGGGLPSRILRIYTNQGITGLGDIRDGTDPRSALMLKSRLIGLNPCNVEMIFKVIKQFGGPGYGGGGVAGVEMACWDICGKAFGVPVWQLLGGRYRDYIRLYADTPSEGSPDEQLAAIKHRMEVQGFTWLKMDMGITSIPGGVTNNTWKQKVPRNAPAAGAAPAPTAPTTAPTAPGVARGTGGGGFGGRGGSRVASNMINSYPFQQIQITDKGIDEACRRIEAVRNMTGPEIPISMDHFGALDENQFIRLCRGIDKYRMGWLEDCFPWFYVERWKRLKEAVETPILTGETMYMLNGVATLTGEGCFKTLLDAQAVDIIHPDLCSNGGILSTKQVGDYAELVGIPMAIHHNSSPVMFMAGVHCAAATENFLVLEHHNLDNQFWDGLVKRTDGKPLWEKGFANVPLDAPGLGIELNEENVKARMATGKTMFEPTEEWNTASGNDMLWI
jgi:L-alanine-DL-glutamate epimerase-like enolase superfamily enzyme